MGRLELVHVGKTYHDVSPAVTAVRDVSLTVERGERLSVVGPSGCGKTTLLRLIAGLERTDAGTVRLNGADLSNIPPERRNIALVFANDALFGHLSAFDNIAYPLRARGCADAKRRVLTEAERVGAGGLLSRRPAQLSSGQRQRVALARALVMDPAVLLLDEPFSRLDAPMRSALRAEFSAIVGERALPTIFVTHDQSEALAFAARVAVMRDGSLVQVGSGRDLYDWPVNTFVAQFIGTPAMSLIRPDGRADGRCMGVRPEAVRLAPDGAWHGVVRAVDDLGADAYAYVDGAFGTLVTRLRSGDEPPRIGQAVSLAIDPSQTHIFAADGTRVERGI